MRIPDSLEPLLEQGIIEEVLRPLMSGKEAQVYLVVAGGEERVAKVYKDAQIRSFKHRSEYTEGRLTRNSRDQRAMRKHSQHGKSQEEAAWRSTEVDMIRRLRAAGVRVPQPHEFVSGVFVMELVKDADGDPAPRLGDVSIEPERAAEIFHTLVREVAKMLCAGVVHGDLSDFNVLLGDQGPVLIDFPQALDASNNRNTRSILLRDVANLSRFLQRFVPDAKPRHYAEEMWSLYEGGELRPDSPLTGHVIHTHKPTDVPSMLAEIDEVRRIEQRRREVLGQVAVTARPRSASRPGKAANQSARPVSRPMPQRIEPGAARSTERSGSRPAPPPPEPHHQPRVRPAAAQPTPPPREQGRGAHSRRRRRRRTGSRPPSQGSPVRS